MATEQETFHAEMENLYLEVISGCVVYSEHFALKYPGQYVPATYSQALKSHELNGCRPTVGHYSYGVAHCHFCGEKKYAIDGPKPEGYSQY